ncbi:MAG: hypothetical protein AB1938_21195 [Myxococcota bacterium]
MTAAVSAAPKSLAIISPLKDFLFFFLSAAVVLVVWFASSVLHVSGFIILAAVAAVSNGPHLVSTWTRVYFDSREWRSKKVATVVIPLLIAAIVFTLTIKLGGLGTRILNSTILYWATWHFVAQNWGILRIYQRKSPEPPGTLAMRLERPLLLLVVLFCLSHRIYTGPRILFGVEVLYPELPRWLVMGMLAPIGVLLGMVLSQRIAERRQPWAKAAWIRLAFIGCSFLGFFVPFQLITSDDTSAFAAAACWHGFQYLGMVRYYHRNTWRAGVDPQARLISWLSQPGWRRLALYMLLLWGLAGGMYGVIYVFSLVTPWDFYTWAGVVWVSLTLSHYWIDGVIWKLRRPELARRVGIDVAASPA